MTTYLYGTALAVPPDAHVSQAKTVRRPKTKPAPEMPASLWRHTQIEGATETGHHRTAGRVLAGAAILSLGSVVYALCQAGALLSGSRLHDAVAAFLR